jgi:uncharacterized phage-associated protein
MDPYQFNLRKAIQAAAVLLREEPARRMSRMRLIKLLYIADRESLRETGEPITGDRAVAMQHGPVLSQVYDRIKGECPRLPEWEEFFASRGRDVEMVKGVPVDDLSRYEIETLQRVCRERADRQDWDVAEETHRFQEWIRNDPGTSARPIPLRDILEAVGRGPNADRIIAEAESRLRMARSIGRDPP